ncbi:CCA tRNA nucleotidyltransferase [Helicobacter canis]|uniref:Poly(A) polymerase n=1 Tax=Helicobacter canis TaxID=29419 RepID=A0A377JLK7_9HELI|nr:CCA tRNA nucleotidyltransferase [Helicobacter canis]STP06436.1 poly(A) polymerase [Helicobacter canis]
MRIATPPIAIPANVLDIIDTLHTHSFQAFVIGGCVRDSLLGLTPKDWDIATNATPQQMQAIFAKTHTIITLGERFGTIILLPHSTTKPLAQPTTKPAHTSPTPNPPTIEITTFRLESTYSDNRRPHSVIYTDNLLQDLMRRDFTCNALAYNPHLRHKHSSNEQKVDSSAYALYHRYLPYIRDGICDYTNGLDDLATRTLRAVGDANARFSEDALRILRALRFQATLDFALESSTRAALLANAKKLAAISAERKQEEWSKILYAPHIAKALIGYGAVWAEVFVEFSKPLVTLDLRPSERMIAALATLEALNSSRDSALFGGDSALRDKAGSLWLAASIDAQVLSPCSPLHNPTFSSQNLESQSGFTKQVQNLESTFQQSYHSPTAKQAIAVQGEAAAGFFRTPRILEEDERASCEKTTDIQSVASLEKVDSRGNALLSSLRENPQGFSWQSIQTKTQNLESIFESPTANQKQPQSKKVDSREKVDCCTTAAAARNDRKIAASEKVDSGLALRLSLWFYALDSSLEQATSCLKALRYKSRIIKLTELLLSHANLPSSQSLESTRILAKTLGLESLALIATFLATLHGKPYAAPLYTHIATIQAQNLCYNRTSLAINGKDLATIAACLGIALHGREIGRLLDTLLDEVICSHLPNTKHALFARAKELIQA